MRAAIYERISQDKTGEAAGVTRQDEDCRILAEELGWQIVEIYVDNDTSATSGKPRPGYRRMLADIEADRIDAIICWHTDRLYRKVLDLEELVSLCEQHKIAVRTCRAGELDLSTPTGRMLARILSSVAQHEVEQKADRWLRSIRQRREAGKFSGSGLRPFGYNRDGTIVEDEAAVIRKITQDILSGMTPNTVCRRLDEQGVKTTTGRAWRRGSLVPMLRNPRIAGLSTLRGEILGLGEWEPILQRPEWERLRAALATQTSKAAAPRRSLLSGLIFCGVEDCGRRLYRQMTSRSMWMCRDEVKSLGHVTISAVPVEQMVEAYAREKLSDDETRGYIAARLSGASSAATALTTDIDAIESEIRELETALRGAGARSKVALARSIDEADEQLTWKRAQLATLSPMTLPEGDDWPDDMDRRSALIRLVVAKVVVGPLEKRGPSVDLSRVEIIPVI